MADVLARTDGAYRHLGRSDDLFKVDARWVSPVAVEDALLEHPAVAEAAVVGRADDQGLTRPAASVVLDEGAETAEGLADELRRHVARRVAPHAAPATVEVVEALPRLPSGKIDRRRLREGLRSA
jgi:acyl-coenzyme A synthetase/AMP-(fatty) acid ligase